MEHNIFINSRDWSMDIIREHYFACHWWEPQVVSPRNFMHPKMYNFFQESQGLINQAERRAADQTKTIDFHCTH